MAICQQGDDWCAACDMCEEEYDWWTNTEEDLIEEMGCDDWDVDPDTNRVQCPTCKEHEKEV